MEDEEAPAEMRAKDVIKTHARDREREREIVKLSEKQEIHEEVIETEDAECK